MRSRGIWCWYNLAFLRSLRLHLDHLEKESLVMIRNTAGAVFDLDRTREWRVLPYPP
jgi:hypothetical protein